MDRPCRKPRQTRLRKKKYIPEHQISFFFFLLNPCTGVTCTIDWFRTRASRLCMQLLDLRAGVHALDPRHDIGGNVRRRFCCPHYAITPPVTNAQIYLPCIAPGAEMTLSRDTKRRGAQRLSAPVRRPSKLGACNHFKCYLAST